MIYFGTLHLENGVPDKQHDRLHDGMGFLTQHLSMTNEYELSLQSVTPSIAMPYWDFTQDITMIRDKAHANKREVDYKDLWDLDIWQEDFFGTSDTHLHTVTKGRWAYTRVPSITRDAEVANAFGLLRAPWNFETSPYVTRYHKSCGDNVGGKGDANTNQWPTCATHHYAVSSIDSFAFFTGYMAVDGHGGVHSYIGGAGGDCDDWSDLTALVGPERVSSMKQFGPYYGRFIWREDMCSMPDSDKCSDISSGKCKLECSGCAEDKFTEAEMSSYSGLFGAMNGVSDFQKEQMVRKVYCDTKTAVGEQIEANSAIDATFWPIHPTLERLLHYKQMVNPLTNFDWDGSLWRSDWSSGCCWGDMFDTDCTGHYEESPTVGKVCLYIKTTALTHTLYYVCSI